MMPIYTWISLSQFKLLIMICITKLSQLEDEFTICGGILLKAETMDFFYATPWMLWRCFNLNMSHMINSSEFRYSFLLLCNFWIISWSWILSSFVEEKNTLVSMVKMNLRSDNLNCMNRTLMMLFCITKYDWCIYQNVIKSHIQNSWKLNFETNKKIDAILIYNPHGATTNQVYPLQFTSVRWYNI